MDLHALGFKQKVYMGDNSYDLGTARASGSPETSVFNTLDNALVMYIAARESGYDKLQSWDRLGIIGGDDSVVAGIPVDAIERVCNAVQLDVKCLLRTPGQSVSFFARHYPLAFEGHPGSACDIMRSLSKMQATTQHYKAVHQPMQVLHERIVAFYVTDYHTPVIHEIVDTYLRLTQRDAGTYVLAVAPDGPEMSYLSRGIKCDQWYPPCADYGWFFQALDASGIELRYDFFLAELNSYTRPEQMLAMPIVFIPTEIVAPKCPVDTTIGFIDGPRDGPTVAHIQSAVKFETDRKPRRGTRGQNAVRGRGRGHSGPTNREMHSVNGNIYWVVVGILLVAWNWFALSVDDAALFAYLRCCQRFGWRAPTNVEMHAMLGNRKWWGQSRATDPIEFSSFTKLMPIKLSPRRSNKKKVKVVRVPRPVAKAPRRPRPPHQVNHSYNTAGVLGGIGGTVGGFIGGPTGAAWGKRAGDFLGKITGMGAYKVNRNSLMTNCGPPVFGNAGSGTIINHREFIQDVTGTTAFTLQSFPVNPGQFQSYPWLSTIAANYEEYEVLGQVYEYKPTCATAVASTNTALGTVIFATNYDALDAQFMNKQQMEAYEFSTSCTPFEHMIHPLECDPRVNVLHDLYIRTGSVPSNADARFYDIGNFQVATVGMQASNVVGELWVSYHVRLIKPRISVPQDSGYLSAHIVEFPAATAAAATILGTGGGSLRSYSTLPVLTTSNTFTLPYPGIYLMASSWVGSIISSVNYASGSNISFLPNLISDNTVAGDETVSGGSAVGLILATVSAAGTGAANTITLSHGTGLTAGTADIFVVLLNAGVNMRALRQHLDVDSPEHLLRRLKILETRHAHDDDEAYELASTSSATTAATRRRMY
jgi:hypothetical protein